MAFQRYDGFVGNIPQKKIDSGLPICPFCGKDPHWLLEIQSGFTSKVTYMCEKCHGKLYTENRGFGFDDNLRVLDLGVENINGLHFDSVYHIKSLNSLAEKNCSSNNSFYSAHDNVSIAQSSKTSSNKKILSFILIFLILFVTATIIICIVASDSVDSNNPPSSETQTSNAHPNDNKSTATLGEINALRAAKNYLNTMPFSYSGLIEQLEFEGYTTSEATYAANNCGANWNEQAAKAAKNYLRLMPFSREELIDQLEFEGYTHSQAVYGAEAVGY